MIKKLAKLRGEESGRRKFHGEKRHCQSFKQSVQSPNEEIVRCKYRRRVAVAESGFRNCRTCNASVALQSPGQLGRALHFEERAEEGAACLRYYPRRNKTGESPYIVLHSVPSDTGGKFNSAVKSAVIKNVLWEGDPTNLGLLTFTEYALETSISLPEVSKETMKWQAWTVPSKLGEKPWSDDLMSS